ncbi:pyridoxamine 5'-phosphate oxidase family protein [Kocuria palustris]|uniref:pyridoxamine 5'-phosphate oxidase family protein n=1 Tax=Kocuria palustris TaxID=71999 RepID=UPI0021B28C47|nr:pyridoxamine 5'-phosphate oxidase family protein [Kocuria palustris]
MSAENPYRDLSRDEMWELLDSEPFGRLAVEAGGFVDIFPVNFVVRGKKLWFRTAPGSKLATLTVNDQVAFEVDRRDEQRLMVSSVVLQGRARRVEDAQERELAESLELRPWVRGFKPVFVVIEPDQINGRAFPVGPAESGASDDGDD